MKVRFDEVKSKKPVFADLATGEVFAIGGFVGVVVAPLERTTAGNAMTIVACKNIPDSRAGEFVKIHIQQQIQRVTELAITLES
ncbi:hypothetical protein PP740_gp026 [Stenotrophomonas phage Philippe]|uniref:Membrane protein n=1 Tax=Stenotrophomonas phage Philippe TaxID=2859655 RepID=A0AAE7WND1_9CAUD|nr:hypothetical protein PP740_gp026 [Stenotrophomonas phage Philippe]QYW02225.1 putative membrane protein [Stenotrophomonas phage Philippe]